MHTATLPLMRGTQPMGLVLAHRAGQAQIRNHEHVPIPLLPEVMGLHDSEIAKPSRQLL